MTYGDIYRLQVEIAYWQHRNFGDSSRVEVVLGLAEEVGEVARATLKQAQGIRGTSEEWDAEVRKELGDVFIKLVDVARVFGLDLETVINERWDAVSRRDWTTDKQGHGIEETG